MTENKTPASTPEDKITIIEKNLHRTNLQRLKDTLCLFFPIAAAFAGCLLADPVWKFFFKNEKAPELIKFGASLVFFAISGTIVFIITRKINPIMKMGIFSGHEKADRLDS